MSTYRIAPSILSADFTRLGEEVISVAQAGADMIHIDVMDNHYVPNLTFGPLVCKALRPLTALPLDVHLMAAPVDDLIKDFAREGANIISFHPEATDHVDRTIQLIQDFGCQAGLVLNPSTPVNHLDWTLEKIDMVLVMSVNPGFGGQQFLEGTLDKVKLVREMIRKSGRKVALQVDGGINVENIRSVASAGGDTFVAGSAIFGANSYSQIIGEMKERLS